MPLRKIPRRERAQLDRHRGRVVVRLRPRLVIPPDVLADRVDLVVGADVRAGLNVALEVAAERLDRAGALRGSGVEYDYSYSTTSARTIIWTGNPDSV